MFEGSPWFTQSCWYSALFTVLASITTATNQYIMLHRVTCLEHPEAVIRRMLGTQREEIHLSGTTQYSESGKHERLGLHLTKEKDDIWMGPVQ